jgi:hypothetical protein
MNYQTVRDSNADHVGIQFDWRPAIDGRVAFITQIRRAEQRSAIDFEVDLRRLAPIELQRLERFLSRRHAGLTSASEVAATLSWLLDCSLQQGQPTLAVHERQATVRALLLADVSQVPTSAGKEEK